MELAICWFAKSMEQESKALARGLRSRHPDLLDRLIEQYHYRLFRYLLALTGNREAAEDLFQETWIRVLEKGHQYNARWRFATWLFTIARHLAIDHLRRRHPQSLEALLDPKSAAKPRELEAADTATPFDRLVEGEDAARLGAALGRLPPTHREVLVLRFQEDLELNEIAEILHSPISTVKSRLYRGLDALRAWLEGGTS
jgi:RNA polymerase sigma-70 factor (ECF subfamily)